MLIRQISRIPSFLSCGKSLVSQRVSSIADHLAAAQNVLPRTRSFHSQVGLTLHFRENPDFDGDGENRKPHGGLGRGQRSHEGHHRRQHDFEDELEHR